MLAIILFDRQQQQALADGEARLRMLSQQPVPPPKAEQESVQSRMADFNKRLLPTAAAPKAVARLLALAEQEGLVIRRGEYRHTQDGADGVRRYSMTLPLQGDALAVQRFIRAARVQQSALALDSVQFKRERIDTDQVEARTNWSLLLQTQPKGITELKR